MDYLENFFDQDVLSVIFDYYKNIQICNKCESNEEEDFIIQCQVCYISYCYDCFQNINTLEKHNKNCIECLKLHKISQTYIIDGEILELLYNFYFLYMDGYFSEDLGVYYFIDSEHEVKEVYKKNKYIDDENNLINRTLDIIDNFVESEEELIESDEEFTDSEEEYTEEEFSESEEESSELDEDYFSN